MRKGVGTMEADREQKEWRDRVMQIAAVSAVSLRNSTASHGVVRELDFVMGMCLAGVLVQKNLREGRRAGGSVRRAERGDIHRCRTFIEALRFEHARLEEEIAGDRFRSEIEALATRRIGAVDQSVNAMVITVGMSAEGVLTSIAEEYGFSKSDALHATAFICLLSALAQAAPGRSGEVVDALLEDMEAKAALWDDLFPSSREAFG